MSECSNTNMTLHTEVIKSMKESNIQFQTIQEEKRKTTIVVEEENEGDRTYVDTTEQSQINNVDEEDEESLRAYRTSRP